MKKIIKHEVYGEIVYEENFWTGKKSVTIDGIPLEKISKKEFKLQDGNTVSIEGGFLQGSNLNIKGESLMLTPKIKWYEIVLWYMRVPPPLRRGRSSENSFSQKRIVDCGRLRICDTSPIL